MARLAFYTFGILHENPDHPQIKGFIDRLPFVFASAENSKGFIDRAVSYNPEDDTPWGDPRANPRFFVEDQHPGALTALSLWDDLESVYAFAYNGRHAEVLSKRTEWFVDPEWPTFVAWWVDDDHTPTREEATEKLEHLHDQGSTPQAFDFKTPFDADGQPWRMEREKIQERAEVVKKYDQDNPTGL